MVHVNLLGTQDKKSAKVVTPAREEAVKKAIIHGLDVVISGIVIASNQNGVLTWFSMDAWDTPYEVLRISGTKTLSPV